MAFIPINKKINPSKIKLIAKIFELKENACLLNADHQLVINKQIMFCFLSSVLVEKWLVTRAKLLKLTVL